MRRPPLPAMLLALSSALCWAQLATRFTVTGTVLNSATGEPIRRALVAVGGSLVFTGPDGRFQAENIPAGQIQIAAQKPGYFDCAHGACEPSGAPTRAIITVNSGTNDVVLKLTPESKIEGRVVDEDGEPISGVQVQVFTEEIADGQKQLRPMGGKATDDSGNYHVENLVPGTYTVKTMARPAFWSQAAIESPAQVYPQRFYPNSPDKSAAQPLDLKPGQIARADFTLTPVRSFRITGSIAPIVAGLAVSVEGADGASIDPEIQFDPKSGKFSLALIPPGTWSLDFTYADREGRGFAATETVTLASSDVTGLRVLLQPLASVTVNIADGSAQVQLASTQSSRGVRVFAADGPSAPDGPRVIANVRPGAYNVSVLPSDGQCLDSLTSGTLDLTREELIVAPGSQSQSINIALRHDCASLQVALHSSTPPDHAVVVLIPESRALQPAVTQLDSASSVLNALSPGDYQVYAFSSIEGLEYANPEVMRDFSGQQITLSPNQRANMTLDVINR